MVLPSEEIRHTEDRATGTPQTTLWSRFTSFRDRWHDASLSCLLVVQVCVTFGLVPLRAEGLPVPAIVPAFTLLVFMSLVIVMARGRWTLVAGVGSLVLSASGLVAGWRGGGRTPESFADILGLVTFAAVSTVVFRAVFKPGRFTAHRILGAVVLYLNLGLLFASFYRIIADWMPGSYAHLPLPGDSADFHSATEYLSFATLTSIGYGDIVPLRPLARSMCMLEAVLGQLLPTILIARVVMLAMREES